MSPIPLCEPVLDGNEALYLAECIESGFVSSVGPFVDRFEAAFAEYVGARHAIACASGTAALHVALLVAGAGPGSLVPVSSFTFLASVNAISYTGAMPLLVDSELQTWNMDTARLHEYIVCRADAGEALPPAIEIVHILGIPADIEPLVELRDRYGIALVEDAAESLGSTYAGGVSVGAVGDIGCFSFNGNKLITAGGGGMIVTNDDSRAERCRHLTTQAKLSGKRYRHDEVGFNYRLTNLAAAVGLAQLEQVETFLAAKRANAARYRLELPAALSATAPAPAEGATSSDWLFSLLDPHGERDGLVDQLNAQGVGCRPVWEPAHLQRPYAGAQRLGGENAEAIGSTGLSLPSSVNLSTAQAYEVLSAVTRLRPDTL